jgi:hypothetical protein
MSRVLKKKKYKVIAKVDAEKFVKYNVNDLVKFSAFLDENFSGWRWFNVYQYSKESNGLQLASFTNRNRPLNRFL